MKLCLDKDVPKSAIRFANTLNCGDKIVSLVDKLDSRLAPTVVEVLNTINNQGVEEFMYGIYCFKVKGDVVPLMRLSSGEKVVLICCLAYLTDTEVALSVDCFMQLDKGTKRLVQNLFDSADIYVYTVDRQVLLYLERNGL